MLSLLIGPLLAPRAFLRRPLSVDRHPPVMTYKANTRQAAAEEGPANATEAKNGIFSNRSVPNQRCGAQVSLSVRLLPGVQSGACNITYRRGLLSSCVQCDVPPLANPRSRSVIASGNRESRNPITGTGCCACAASGQAAAPLSSDMNSR